MLGNIALSQDALSSFNGGNLYILLTGQSMTVSQGVLTPSNALTLSGQSLSISQGTFGITIARALLGQLLTVSQGDLVVNTDKEISGHGMTLSQGNFSVDVSKALSGQTLTVSQGAFTVVIYLPYPLESQVLAGVVYGPNMEFVGTLTTTETGIKVDIMTGKLIKVLSSTTAMSI